MGKRMDGVITLTSMIVMAVLVTGLIAALWLPVVKAQSYGTIAFGQIAPTVAQCPAGSAGTATLCAVGTATAGYTMYVSYNAGAYALLAPSSACPTCVTSFNGRPGPAITLTKADVTGTNVGVNVTVTAPTATATLN